MLFVFLIYFQVNHTIHFLVPSSSRGCPKAARGQNFSLVIQSMSLLPSLNQDIDSSFFHSISQIIATNTISKKSAQIIQISCYFLLFVVLLIIFLVRYVISQYIDSIDKFILSIISDFENFHYYLLLLSFMCNFYLNFTFFQHVICFILFYPYLSLNIKLYHSME